MILLTPNATYKVYGVTVKEKIIPDGMQWQSAKKARKAGFALYDPYKQGEKLNNKTGKPLWITIYNKADPKKVKADAAQYTLAAHNENMGASRVHFYVDSLCAWQNLKAGTSMCENDPMGSAEVSWRAGDSSTPDGGDMTSLSIEIITNDTTEHDKKACENGAKLAAWLLWHHGLNINSLVTHTYWDNKANGKHFSDIDEQCATAVPGKKWDPACILGSSAFSQALCNWKLFKQTVDVYLCCYHASSCEHLIGPDGKMFQSLL